MIVDIGDTCTHCGEETLTNKRIPSSADAEISVVFNERERIFPARIDGYMCVDCQHEECDHETSVASTSYPPWDGYQCIKCGALFDEEMEPYNQKGE